MCTECSLAVCPSSCPARWGGEDLCVCEICGDAVTDDCFSGNGVYVCAACADDLTVSEILALCDFTDTGELLEELGFREGKK